jgi:cell fate regulator YaaT (PSP1 superfamily)
MSAGQPGAIVTVKTATGHSVRAMVPLEFDPSLADGDVVVVTVDGAPMLGTVTPVPEIVCSRCVVSESIHVLRRATPQDLYLRQRHVQRERDALRVAVMKVRERGLAMKLVRVEEAFDGSKLVFYFTADERVDFRELVRELASEYKTRIELRQIGVRDEAKMLAGYGTCGRPLCCSAFLRSFDPVSIKMAKQQDLALNPSRLSGLCGRLKCCLRYELMPGQVPQGKDVHDEAYPGASDEGAGRPAPHGPAPAPSGPSRFSRRRT